MTIAKMRILNKNVFAFLSTIKIITGKTASRTQTKNSLLVARESFVGAV